MSKGTVWTTIQSQVNRTDSAIYDTVNEMRALELEQKDIAERIELLGRVLARLQGEMKAYENMLKLWGPDHAIEVEAKSIEC